MTRKIINIVVFLVAIVAGVLAIFFAANFDDDKLEQYKAVCTLYEDAQGQKMLADFGKVKVDNLDAFMQQTQDQYNTMDDSLRAEKKLADDFFNYVNVLKTTASTDFAGFKANYPDNIQSLLTFDADGKAVKQFQSLKDEKELENYILTDLNTDYTACRQQYLRNEEKCASMKIFIKNLENVAGINDVSEKTKQLENLQSDCASFTSTTNNFLAPSFYIFYILLAITFVALVAFALVNIIANFKTAYKVLLALLGLVVIAVICFLCASPEVNNEVYTKLQIAPETSRMIEAGIYLCYVVFFAAIAAIVCCPFIARIRGNRSINAAGKSVK